MSSSAEMMLRARWVAPMNRPVIEDGGVVVAGGAILAVGDASELRQAHPGATEQDLGRLWCEIQIAPAVPMEFITLRIALGEAGKLEVFT